MTMPRTRRNVILLAACQALFMTTTSAMITSIALVGFTLAEDKVLSTIPVAFQFGATMAMAIPASLYMKRVGRQLGFITGSLIGAGGGVVATLAVLYGDFWLFCIGCLIIGGHNGFAQYFRFAAADVADVTYRSRAISLVLAGGVVASVTGPTLAQFTSDLFDPVLYAGTFAAVVAVYLSIMIVMLFVRIPTPTALERSGSGRPIGEIMRQPKVVVAVLGSVVGYLVMSFLMTVTPLAMAECNFSFADSAMVIQFHILGMFAPSFITGHLINRYGVTNVMLAGALMEVGCVAINISGVGFANFAVALTLVGVGWNFLFIGGTTLLTECYTPAEKAKTQGVNDFCVWGAVTIGALLSGASNHAFGWTVINYGVAPLILLALAGILWLKLKAAQAPAAA
jgi:predicted MFS family arabinose efflux permease